MLFSLFQGQYLCRKYSSFITKQYIFNILITFTNWQGNTNFVTLVRYHVTISTPLLCQKILFLKLELLENSLTRTSNWYQKQKVPYYKRVLHNRNWLSMILMFVWIRVWCCLNRKKKTTKRSNRMDRLHSSAFKMM